MKRKMRTLALFILGMFFILSFTLQQDYPNIAKEGVEEYLKIDTIKIEFKGEVKTIIDQKCYDCHSKEGEDEDAKDALLWDELPKMNPDDQVSVLDAVIESVENGDMPPSKHVFWKPSKKLSKEEAERLIDWADDLAGRIYEANN